LLSFARFLPTAILGKSVRISTSISSFLLAYLASMLSFSVRLLDFPELAMQRFLLPTCLSLAPILPSKAYLHPFNMRFSRDSLLDPRLCLSL
jgi:hypothetical protein